MRANITEDDARRRRKVLVWHRWYREYFQLGMEKHLPTLFEFDDLELFE